MMAMGAVAALLVSGVAFALMSSADVSAEDETPEVTVEEETTETTYAITAHVECRVDGSNITLEGVNVTVYTVNVTEDDDTTTIVIHRVAQGLTDSEGNVTFDLPEGSYVVCATCQGLCGFGEVNLTEDQLSTIVLHGDGWGGGRDQTLQDRDVPFGHRDLGEDDRNETNGTEGFRHGACDGACNGTIPEGVRGLVPTDAFAGAL